LAEKDGKRPVLWTPLQAEPIVGGTPGSAGGAAAGVKSDKLDGRPSREQSLKTNLEAKYPGLEIKDLTSALHTLRGLKLPGEIALLRRSAEIAAEGHVEAMRSARPGLFEFQVAAVARYVFSLRGAGPDAYGAIVGAGKNGCALHYMKNDAELKDGDLVVMDYAATVRGYASDVTRTFPANGHFSKEQRQLVQDIYDVQQQLIAMVKPGAKISSISATCNDLLSKRGYRVDHGPCHHVGLAVHDPGPDELEAGMVLTVEPGAYLRNKGMGCRIEDTVLVTDKGCEILSAGVPSSPDAIEKLMAEKGMVDVPVGLAKKP
jgi:Xaa-Pro aminopeptidase